MDRHYESMVILKPDLSDQEKEEIFDKITKKIESLNGKVLSSKVWAKERNFYYFLREPGAGRKKYYKGFYWLINFTIDKDKLSELRETMRLEERILRRLIMNKGTKLEAKATVS